MTWWRWLGIAVACAGLGAVVLTHPDGRRPGLRAVAAGAVLAATNLGVVQLGLTVGGTIGMLSSIPLFVAAHWFGRSPLGLLNFYVLQWFGVRLARTSVRCSKCGAKTGYGCSIDCLGWPADAPVWRDDWRPPLTLLRWVWPLTGWWSPYRYIRP